jgi:lipopolysaccharide/colanic/teichoic acid biosynthesis glycosyltransferase
MTVAPDGGWLFEPAKRSFDVLVASIGLLVLSPGLLLIAAAVGLTSPGGIFYRGVRAGRYGVPFQIFKFRSMVVGADAGPGTTSRHDERVTALGGVLRRFKLDELPQLLNVLSGEMSLVGPRPELMRYTDQYSGEEGLILSVRPGITDFASIEFADLNSRIDDADPDGGYERTVLVRKNALRLKYVRERSFRVDLGILIQTFLRLTVLDVRRKRT